MKRRDLERIEHAQDVELALLRDIGGVGEECEGDMHAQKVSRGARKDKAGGARSRRTGITFPRWLLRLLPWRVAATYS